MSYGKGLMIVYFLTGALYNIFLMQNFLMAIHIFLNLQIKSKNEFIQMNKHLVINHLTVLIINFVLFNLISFWIKEDEYFHSKKVLFKQ